MLLSHYEKCLERALANPAVQADTKACNVKITFVFGDAKNGESEHHFTLWKGDAEGKELICRASKNVWNKVFTPMPPVGYQSFGALRRRANELAVEGSELCWVQALPLLERVLEASRQPNTKEPDQHPRHLDALRHIRGQYIKLQSDVETWVYSEECGETQSPPLLMLHTAGSDARQWHGLMAQESLRKKWRLLGFDLPGHGRSPLPSGQENWTWQLDQDQYIDWVLRYLDAMKIERVALMGCSMGAAIGLPLLARHPDRFYGAILLETPYCSPGRRSPYLNNSQVHGSRLSAAWVGALLSPSSPAAGRNHATWIYSQSAPSVYDGDLAFYSDQFDAHQHTAKINTSVTPLWLLTGDYDYSATPADSLKVANEISGAKFAELPGFGHFPMVENPDGLMSFLNPTLSTLRAHILTKKE